MIKLQTICAGVTLRQQDALLIENVLSPYSVTYYLSRAQALRYEEQAREFGKRKVRQDVWSAPVRQGSELDGLADQLQDAIESLLGYESFDAPLQFNHRNIQRYEHNSHGIDPHKDHHHNYNLVALFGLAGEGTFTLYDELGGSPRLELIIRPNSLLLMKAPGFCGEQKCPWHGVSKIVGGDDGQRYLLGLRQNDSGE